MIRENWIRAGVLGAFLACTASGWGQVLQPERFIMVKEADKPELKCRVIKCWTQKDGSKICQVQPVAGGEMMTIVEDAPSTSSSMGSRLFKGRDFAPSSSKVVTREVVSSTTTTSPTTKSPSLVNRVFGKSSSSSREPAHTVTRTEVVPARPSDLRQSWGQVDLISSHDSPTGITQLPSSRTSLPMAKQPVADPIERPESFTSVPSKTLPIEKTTAIETPGEVVISTATLPTPPSPKPTALPGLPQESVAMKAMKNTTRQPETARPARTGLISTMFDRSSTEPRGTTVKPVVASGETVVTETVVKTPQTRTSGMFLTRTSTAKQPAGCSTCAGSCGAETKVVANVTRKTSQPTEAHIGMFARVKPAQPRVPETKAPVHTGLPHGMSSIAAANAPALGIQGAIGVVVRTPEGQNVVVPFTQPGGGQMVSIPASAPNAFTTPSNEAPAGIAPNHMMALAESAATPAGQNAFTMAHSSRPIPSDMGMQHSMPNGFYAMGIGGAERRPPITTSMGVPYQPPSMPYAGMAWAQQPTSTGYYQVGYHPQVAAYPSAMPVVAAAPDTTQSHAVWLATLRQSILPSEREVAAEALGHCNHKADPQVVPALVTAAEHDPAPTVRVSCVRALVNLRANDPQTVETLKTLKNHDTDVRVRQEAGMLLPTLAPKK